MGIIVFLACVIAATGLVSFTLRCFIRPGTITITVTFIISELIFLLWSYLSVASSSDAPEIVGAPPLVAIAIAPIILTTAFTYGVIAERIRRRNSP